jgi:hypothetical protein
MSESSLELRINTETPESKITRSAGEEQRERS